MPISAAARITRMAISERFATRSLRILRDMRATLSSAAQDAGPRVGGAGSELVLDAQEPVVLLDPIAAAHGSRLDLTRVQADGDVGDDRVGSLARAVGDDHAVVVRT